MEIRSEINGPAGMQPTSEFQRLSQPSQVPAIAPAPKDEYTDAIQRSSSPVGSSSSHASVPPEERQCDGHDNAADVPQPYYENETPQAKKDRLMLELRVSTGPENLDVALETIQPFHAWSHRAFRQAITDVDRLENLRLYRAYIFSVSIDQLWKHQCVVSKVSMLMLSLLPQCLADCQILVDSDKLGPYNSWRRLSSKAGA